MSRRNARARRLRRSVPILVAAAALAGLLTITATGTASGTHNAYPGNFVAKPNTITPGATFTGAKSQSGYAAKTDRSLLHLHGSKLVNVMIKYDFDALASYNGRIQGLRATSPRATGKSFARNRVAVARYNRYTAKRTARINRAVRALVPRVRIGTQFRVVYGGVAARVPANQIAKLLRVRGVDAVQRDALRQPLDDNTTFIGAQAVWPSLGGDVHAAENVKVGVIDTGVWPEHPMLADKSLPGIGGSFGCEFGDGSDTAHLGPTFDCNNKLIGAYAKTATR